MKILWLFAIICLFAFSAAADPAIDPSPTTDEEAMEALHEESENVKIAVRNVMVQIGVYDSETCEPGDIYGFMAPAAIIIIILGAGLAIFYMAGSFVNSPQILAMAKQEAYELVHTTLIIALFASFWIFTQTVLGINGLGPDDIFSDAMEYSMLMIQKISADIFWLSIFNTLLYMLYSAPLRVGGALHMAIHFNLGAVLKPFVDGVGTMASLLSFALGEWMVNLIVLCYIKKYMFTLFLPIGILLKAFPQTRGGGNAIIALAIAFTLIYPMMLVMNYEAYNYQYGMLSGRSGVEAVVSDFLVSSGIGSMALYAIFMQGMLKTIPGIFALSWGITGFFDLYTDVIYTVFVLSIFLPLLNIFVTFTFARELAKYFGTEINLAAFVKMV